MKPLVCTLKEYLNGEKTLQEVVDYIQFKINEQKVPSMEGPHCRYQKDGKNSKVKCAIGWLIPNKDYDASFEEGYDAFDLIKNFHKELNLNEDILENYEQRHKIYILRNLQLAHDGCKKSTFLQEYNDNMNKFRTLHMLEPYQGLT